MNKWYISGIIMSVVFIFAVWFIKSLRETARNLPKGKEQKLTQIKSMKQLKKRMG